MPSSASKEISRARPEPSAAVDLAVIEAIVRKVCLRVGDRRDFCRGGIQKKESGPTCADQPAAFAQPDAANGVVDFPALHRLIEGISALNQSALDIDPVQ